MSNTLDNIFNSIYLSEQESKSQHEYLSNIKSQIFTSEKEVRQTEQRCTDLREIIAKKTRRLGNREVTLKTFKIRNELLKERIRELNSEKDLLLENQAELKAELTSMRNQFCAEAAKFDEEFGFSKKRPKSTYISGNYQKCGNLTKASSNEMNTNVGKTEIERNQPELDGMDELLFDVDFNCSPLD